MLLGHRYYDAGTGRFISQDPIHDGTNWYAYCENNPLVKTDPEGEAAALVLGGVAIGAGAIVGGVILGGIAGDIIFNQGELTRWVLDRGADYLNWLRQQNMRDLGRYRLPPYKESGKSSGRPGDRMGNNPRQPPKTKPKPGEYKEPKPPIDRRPPVGQPLNPRDLSKPSNADQAYEHYVRLIAELLDKWYDGM